MTKGRLEAFSDGVFGVAITLLILDVRPDDGSTGWQVLSHEWHHILVFLLSFVLVGVYWVAHHHMMHFIAATNRILLWLNLTLLLFIVFIPFVAALLSSTHADASSIRIYGATLIFINLTGSSMWSYAGYGHRLMHPAVPDAFIHYMLFLHSIPILLYGTAIAVASWQPLISLALFVIVPAFFILPNPWLDKHIRHAMEAIHAHDKKHGEPSE